jgi:hypothetical protein
VSKSHHEPELGRQCGWIAARIDQDQGLSLVVWIELTEDQRKGITVPPGDQQRVARVLAGVIDKAGIT